MRGPLKFTIYSQPEEHESSNSYFQVHTDQTNLFSSVYPDKEAGLKAIGALVRQLRTYEKDSDDYIAKVGDHYFIRLHGIEEPAIARNKPFVQKSDAQRVLYSLHEAAQGEVFEVTYLQLRQGTEKFSSQYDFDLTSEAGAYLRPPATVAENQLSFPFFGVKKQDLYYFLFQDPNGQPFLFSPSFQKVYQRDQGLTVFLYNAANPERWQVVVGEGYYYLSLRTRHGHEVARSRLFSDRGTLERLQEQFLSEFPEWKERLTPQGAIVRKRSQEELDNYNFSRPSTSGSPGFETFSVTRQGKEQHFFHINDEVGQAFFFSEGYLSVKSRDNGIRSVIRNLHYRDHFSIEEKDGQYFFILFAGNYQEIGRSRLCSTMKGLNKQISWLQLKAGEWALDYDLEQIWEKTGSSTLRIEKEEQPPLTTPVIPKSKLTTAPIEPFTPIFKVLQPYEKKDKDTFYGREQEIDDLYEMTFDTRLLLLYGERGVGKTSLIQCGLANRIRETRWQAVFVHRKEEHIICSLSAALRKEIAAAEENPTPTADDPTEALKQLYQLTFKPAYLVFDQLEELFEAPADEAEPKEFFTFLERLLVNPPFPVRIILVIREAYLGKLTDYEPLIPTLLEHRYHLHSLTKSCLEPAVENLLGSLEAQKKIGLIEPKEIAKEISERLTANKSTVSFTCLQIYLHQLHQAACSTSSRSLPVFSPILIERMGQAWDLIEEYLTDRRRQVEKQSPGNQAPSPAQAREIDALVYAQNQCCGPVSALPHGVGIKNERLRLLLLVPLILLLIGFALIYSWLIDRDPCHQARQADTTEAYMNYLCRYGELAACSAEFIKILDERESIFPAWSEYKMNNPVEFQEASYREESSQPAEYKASNSAEFREMLDNDEYSLWTKYRMAKQIDSCWAYLAYYEKYRYNTNVCINDFQQILIDRRCVMDTIYKTIIRRDTETVKQYIYVPEPSPPVPPVEDCKEFRKFGDITFKAIGPLWVMTEDLGGGPYNWMEGLRACRKRGMRLPCEGEILYIYEHYYKKDEYSAYENLVATGRCDAFAPGRYWTATESDDDHAWAINFNKNLRRIEIESQRDKTTELPCRCVFLDQQKKSRIKSDMPRCYDKEINHFSPGG